MPPANSASERRATVLVVEPDELSRAGLAMVLERDGHRVLETRCAEDALYLLTHRAIDLLIVAQTLAGMDGASLAQELRDRRGPPVILIDDYTKAASRVQHLDHGIVADLVTRHDDPRTVAARCAALLRRTLRSALPLDDAPADQPIHPNLVAERTHHADRH